MYQQVIMMQGYRVASAIKERVIQRWCLWIATINIASTYTMLALDRIPGLRRVHDDGIISLFERHDRFMDWINPIAAAGISNPYSMIVNNANPSYGPLAYLLLRPISSLIPFTSSRWDCEPKAAESMVGLLTWLPVAGAALIITAFIVTSARQTQCKIPLWDCLRRKRIDLGCLAFILLSYPTVFAFDRGNLDLVMLPLVTAYVYCVYNQISEPNTTPGKSLLSGALLTVAACIKPYLLIFSAFNPHFIPRGLTYSRFIRGLTWIATITLATIVVTLISLAILSGGHPDLRGLLAAQQHYMKHYTMGESGNLWYLSPHTLFKKLLFHHSSPATVERYTVAYVILSGLACVAMLRNMQILKTNLSTRSTVALSTIILAMLIFPGLSNEYKAIYVVIPILMGRTINDAADETPSHEARRMLITSMAFCLFISLNRYSLIGDVRAVSALSALMLLIFTVIFLLPTDASKGRETHQILSTPRPVKP